MSIHKALVGLCLLVFIFGSWTSFSEAEPIQTFLPKNIPEEWVQRDAPRMFSKQTLFEHIDGQADLFLQYGFQESVFATYHDKKTTERRIDVDIYDMGNVLLAFGIFSRFRSEDRPADIGLDSSESDHYVFFYRDQYFVAIQCSDPCSSSVKLLAQEIASRIPDNSSPPREIAYFPRSGLKPGSLEYFPDGLLGLLFLGRGFKASYRENDDRKTAPDGPDFQLFLSIFENSQEAENALRNFRYYLSTKGRLTEGISVQFGADAVIGVDPYQGKAVVVNKGPFLLGAVGFEQDEAAERRLTELIKQVK
ncbi:MAG: hypothetical protein QG577_1163 [Thermodesulfobacteriota bacterium]|nr:hypothetical protein [Thermodesulfobacteriota bacterium]